jgi:TetR/AcrR family transcriptional repressor of nem operon
VHATKRRLLDAGLSLLLTEGYNALGIQRLLHATGTPKGSFYHHFESKEQFALQVVDRYMEEVHAGLDATLGDPALPPLDRVRGFFEATRDKYARDGHLGCMLGGLGQELAGVSPVFREKIDACFGTIESHLRACLTEAQQRGDLPRDTEPAHLAELLVNCWEGAALRSRLRRDHRPLDDMLEFYFGAIRG